MARVFVDLSQDVVDLTDEGAVDLTDQPAARQVHVSLEITPDIMERIEPDDMSSEIEESHDGGQDDKGDMCFATSERKLVPDKLWLEKKRTKEKRLLRKARNLWRKRVDYQMHCARLRAVFKEQGIRPFAETET